MTVLPRGAHPGNVRTRLDPRVGSLTVTPDGRDAELPAGRMNEVEGGVSFWTPPHALDVRFRVDRALLAC